MCDISAVLLLLVNPRGRVIPDLEAEVDDQEELRGADEVEKYAQALHQRKENAKSDLLRDRLFFIGQFPPIYPKGIYLLCFAADPSGL